MPTSPGSKSRRLQFSLFSLLVLLTLVAIAARPGAWIWRHWQETRRSKAADATVSRAVEWLRANQARNDSWAVSPSAGQSQESDLPGTK